MFRAWKWEGMVLLIVLMVGICWLAPSSSATPIDNHPSYLPQSITPVTSLHLQEYQISEGINISDDEDFLEYNFTGKGTHANPYLIENLNITVETQSAIKIVNVTKWFTIQNCLIVAKKNEYHCMIEIRNASNWVLSRSTMRGANRINRIHECANVNITENSFTHLWYGIEFSDSERLVIKKNDFRSIESVGIVLSSAKKIQINNNTFSDCREGMEISYVSSTVVEANNFSNSVKGIEYYQHKKGLLIKGNVFKDLSSAAITSTSILAYSKPGLDSPIPPTLTVVRGNMLKNCKYGLTSSYSSSDLFINNTLLDCFMGLFLGDTKYVRVVGNNIADSHKYGIRMLHSHRNLAYGNVVTGSGMNNAYDENGANVWDDTNGTGNCWSDYNGTTLYRIPGTSHSFDRWPSRCGHPLIAPFVEHPVILRGETMNVSWWAYDSDPRSYSIQVDGEKVHSSSWDGSNITFSLQGYAPGEYNVTATVRDWSTYSSSSSIIVTIETNMHLITIVGVALSAIGVAFILKRRYGT